MDTYGIYLFAANAAVFCALLASFAGCVVPVLPGPALAAAAVLAHKIFFPEFLDWGAVYWCLGAGAAAQVLDFLMSWLGAKRFGATWRGALGAVVGAAAAVFVPPQPIAFLILPFLFALLAELLGGARLGASFRAGVGAFLGGVLAALAKMAACAVILCVFALAVYNYYF